MRPLLGSGRTDRATAVALLAPAFVAACALPAASNVDAGGGSTTSLAGPGGQGASAGGEGGSGGGGNGSGGGAGASSPCAADPPCERGTGGGAPACDWYRMSPDGRCYRLIVNPVSWELGQGLCETWGGNLAAITDAPEQAFVTKLASDADIRIDDFYDAWIGGSKTSAGADWTWSSAEPFEYTIWGAGQPSDAQSEWCIKMLEFGAWKWADDSCDEPFYAVCER